MESLSCVAVCDNSIHSLITNFIILHLGFEVARIGRGVVPRTPAFARYYMYVNVSYLMSAATLSCTWIMHIN